MAKYNSKKKVNEADDNEIEPAYNKNAERQYNKKVFNAAEVNDQDFEDTIESFDEAGSPVSDFETIGTKTKTEQELSMKALDLSLDVVKLLAGYDVDTVFKVAALIQRYISMGPIQS